MSDVGIVTVDLTGRSPDDALAVLMDVFVRHVGTASGVRLAWQDLMEGYVRKRAAETWAATRRLGPPANRPPRSPRFLAFVRELPCCFCGAPGPSDPHHVGRHGMGTKATDYSVLPLCRKCHDEWHAGRDPRPETERDLKMGHEVAMFSARILAAYVQALEGT